MTEQSEDSPRVRPGQSVEEIRQELDAIGDRFAAGTKAAIATHLKNGVAVYYGLPGAPPGVMTKALPSGRLQTVRMGRDGCEEILEQHPPLSLVHSQ